MKGCLNKDSLLLFCCMFRKILFSLVVACSTLLAQAQADSSGLRISLLTCATGEQIWEQFGHTAVRVTDSINGTDYVYNYGTFSFGEGFELQFMRGKLLYYVSYYPYQDFLKEYTYLQRSIEEQVLNLKPAEKHAMQDFLVWNVRDENKYYKYDFFFDNCATRIRDIFPKALGADFEFDKTLPENSTMTFRDLMDIYFYKTHFERLGCNLLLGSRIDAVMTNYNVMWHPFYLRDAVSGATSDGRVIAGEAETVLEMPPRTPAGPNWPFIILVLVSILTISGLIIPQLRVLGNIMSFLLLFVTGLLGCLMLVMWLWTDHQGCQNNYNVLWALPTNLFLAFLPKRNKSRYAMVAIILIFVSLLLHILNVQGLPLLELSPLLLALLFVFSSIIRKKTHEAR